MTGTWLKNSDGTLSCTRCGSSRFRQGHHCACPVDGAEVFHRTSPGTESSDLEHSASAPSACLRPILGWDQRFEILDGRHESIDSRLDQLEEGADDPDLKCALVRLRIQNLDGWRKNTSAATERAKQRGEVELVERMERAVAELRHRRGRLSRDPGVQ